MLDTQPFIPTQIVFYCIFRDGRCKRLPCYFLECRLRRASSKRNHFCQNTAAARLQHRTDRYGGTPLLKVFWNVFYLHISLKLFVLVSNCSYFSCNIFISWLRIICKNKLWPKTTSLKRTSIWQRGQSLPLTHFQAQLWLLKYITENVFNSWILLYQV